MILQFLLETFPKCPFALTFTLNLSIFSGDFPPLLFLKSVRISTSQNFLSVVSLH